MEGHDFIRTKYRGCSLKKHIIKKLPAQ